MMMQWIRIIISNLLILNILLWFYHETLHIFKFKKSIIGRSIIGGIVAAGSVLVINTLIQGLGASISNHTISTVILSSVIISLSALLIIRSSIYKYPLIISLTLIPLVYYSLGSQLASSSVWISLGYFIVVTSIEESYKIIASTHSRLHGYLHASDSLIVSTLCALSFAATENIIVSTTRIQSIIRTPVFLIHIALTGIIARSLLISIQYKQYKYLIVALGVMLSIALHIRYNTRGGITIYTTMALGAILYFLYSYIQYHNLSIYASQR